MPLHLDSITNNSQDSSLIAWILQSGTQECDSAFATPDKKYIHNTDDTRRIFLSLCFTCTLSAVSTTALRQELDILHSTSFQVQINSVSSILFRFLSGQFPHDDPTAITERSI